MTAKISFPGIFSYPEHFDTGDAFLEEAAVFLRNMNDVSTVEITYCRDERWIKATAGITFHKTSLPNALYRTVAQEERYVEIEDCIKHPSYKFTCMNMDNPMIRFISCMPLFDGMNTVTGAITLIGHKSAKLPDRNVVVLETVSRMISVYMSTKP